MSYLDSFNPEAQFSGFLVVEMDLGDTTNQFTAITTNLITTFSIKSSAAGSLLWADWASSLAGLLEPDSAFAFVRYCNTKRIYSECANVVSGIYLNKFLCSISKARLISFHSDWLQLGKDAKVWKGNLVGVRSGVKMSHSSLNLQVLYQI